MTLPQLRVLYHLRRHPGATTGELARRLGITVSTTSGLVIKLVDRGLVVRGSLADDRRQAPLRLSDDGTALLGELSGEGRSYLESVAEQLGEHLETVTLALERLAEAGALALDGTAAFDGTAPRDGPAAKRSASAHAHASQPTTPPACSPHDAPAQAGDTTADHTATGG